MTGRKSLFLQIMMILRHANSGILVDSCNYWFLLALLSCITLGCVVKSVGGGLKYRLALWRLNGLIGRTRRIANLD